jgi:hypothetical protein
VNLPLFSNILSWSKLPSHPCFHESIYLCIWLCIYRFYILQNYSCKKHMFTTHHMGLWVSWSKLCFHACLHESVSVHIWMFTYFKPIRAKTHGHTTLYLLRLLAVLLDLLKDIKMNFTGHSYQVIMTRDVPASLCKSIFPWNMLKKIFCWCYTSCK